MSFTWRQMSRFCKKMVIHHVVCMHIMEINFGRARLSRTRILGGIGAPPEQKTETEIPKEK